MKHKYKIGDKFYSKFQDNQVHKCKILELYHLPCQNLHDREWYPSYKIKIYGDIFNLDDKEFPVQMSNIQISAECMLCKLKSDAEAMWAIS